MSDNIKDLFKPTVKLRWYEMRDYETDKNGNAYGYKLYRVLQQLFVNCNTEEEQWRDVPTE